MFYYRLVGYLSIALFLFLGLKSQTIVGPHGYSAYLPSINVNINSSLSFQIKIDTILGLILYAEDEHTNCFVSLILLKSAKLRLDIGLFYRYHNPSNISLSERQVRTPDYLSTIVDLSKVDNLLQEWHTIIISVFKNSLVIQFNNIKEKIMIPSHYQRMERITGYIGGKIFFGGLPRKMRLDATNRVFFSSAIEPSFNGRISAVRIVRFISSLFLIPVMIEYESESMDTCYFDSNFCRYCPLSRPCSDYKYVTIDHNSEIRYDFPIDPSSDNNRTMTMDFKTKQDNSFLFYIGYFQSINSKPSQFLAVFIENGIFYAIVSIPNTINPTYYTKKIYCQSVYKQCSDNKWHSVQIKYDKDDILISLDGISVQFDTAVVRNSTFVEIVIANSPGPFEIYRNTYFHSVKPLNSFRGCLSQVHLEQNNVKVNIIEMVAKNVYKFKTKGLIHPNKCVDLFPLVPVTFHSSSDYLQIPVSNSFKHGKVTISFRTFKQNCLLAFNPSSVPLYFHSVEIRESRLFLYVMYGTEVMADFITQKNVSNGESHQLELFFRQNTTAFAIDGGENNAVNFTWDPATTDFHSEWFLGSMPKKYILRLPSKIWSVWLRQFFSGCIMSMRINDEDIQLDLLLGGGNLSIKIGCLSTKEIQDLSLCANKPCNEGVCHTDWDQTRCDCGDSNFTQPTCSKEATVAEFNGYQFMRITLADQYQSEVEDIAVRFLSKLPDGLILSAGSQFTSSTDKLQIFMKNGNIYLLLNFGQGNKKFKTNENCFDGKWHSIKIKRRRKNLQMWIDGNFYQFNEFLNLEMPIVRIKHLLVGSLFYNRSDFQSDNDGLTNDIIGLARSGSSKNDLFVGYMMHFVFNGVNYFDLAKDRAPINIEVTAALRRTNHISQFPVYFQSAQSYLLISKVNIFGDFRLEFLLKTTHPSGLVLLLKGDSGDYLFLEMVDRVLHIVYNWGSGYKRKASENGPLDDNYWHSVKIVRYQSKTQSFAFRVDGIPEGDRADVPVERGGINFNHYGRMYLGGYRDNESIVMFDNETPRSKNGFQGCIASFYVNNSLSSETEIKYKDLLQDATKVNGVQGNCPSLRNSDEIECSVDYCSFGGTCVQQWNTISCDCSMTSFTGKKCQDPSTTVEFLKSPAYIIYKYIVPRNNTIDKVTVGFQTATVKDVSLISIMDVSQQQEVLGMKIKISEARGFIDMTYNVGGHIYSILETRLNVIDGLYHIVRFTRQGVQATLQVDDLSRRIYVPDDLSGSNQYIEHSLIVLGSRVVQNRFSFQGYMSGVNLNNIPLTEMVMNPAETNTHLINKSNIVVVPSFVPRLSDRSSLSLRQSEEEAKTPKSNPTANKLVIAKLNCTGVSDEEKYQCQFTNSKGLIRPGITHRKLDKKTDDDETISSQTLSVLSTLNPTDSDSGTRLSVSDIKIYPDNINSQNRRIANDSVNINLWLIVAFSSAGAFLLVALSCLIYRCSTKDEGSYSVEDDRICIQTREKTVKLNLKPLQEDKINEELIPNSFGKKCKTKRRCGDAKEWYV